MRGGLALEELSRGLAQLLVVGLEDNRLIVTTHFLLWFAAAAARAARAKRRPNPLSDYLIIGLS